MKKYSILLCLMVLNVIFYGCSSKNDNGQQLNDPLHGYWNMTSWVGGGIVHVNEQYELGERSLIVNTQNKTLTFIDNIYPENFSDFNNHEHNYLIVANEDGALVIEQLFYENGTVTHNQYLAEIVELTENLLVLKEHTTIIPQVYTFENK